MEMTLNNESEMTNRKWLYKEIVESGKFLRMSSSAQNLYYHLVLNTDDNGIVDGYKVMQMINSNIGDLELLHDRGFVKVLNEYYLTYVYSLNELKNGRYGE